VLAALGAAGLILAPLLLLDGDRRTFGFRAAVAVLAVVALRAITTFTAEAEEPPRESPFARTGSAARPPGSPTRSVRGLLRTRARRRTPPRSAADALVIGAVERSGQFHHRLRPLLRQIADERLRAHHGIGIDEDTAAGRHLGPTAWALLRPDREPPEDRWSPGPDPATIAATLDALEAL
jgi:hypothetical protein